MVLTRLTWAEQLACILVSVEMESACSAHQDYCRICDLSICEDLRFITVGAHIQDVLEMRPTQKEPRIPGPLGGPHTLFDGSFILEFLQPGPDLDASVLMRATYVGGHEATKRGKAHPQVSENLPYTV
jgi:hypothetical protein